LSVLILVLLLVSFITVMFHLGYLISLTHLCLIAFCYCISYWLMYWSIQLHSCKNVL